MSSLESFIGKYSFSFTKMQKLVAWFPILTHPLKKKKHVEWVNNYTLKKLSFKWSKIITFNTNILIYCEK